MEVSSHDCGVRVEHMPWASGKKQLTDAYAWFLASWARLSWKEVATVFHASWDSVFRSVEMAVEWGRPENLTEKQETRLAELLQCNLKSIRAYLLKEEFQLFWRYVSPYWAGRFLDSWCTEAMPR